MILAMDTATRYAGIALYDERGVLLERTWLSNANHTVELMPTVMEALAQQGTTVGELEGVAVALGPGSYTGLRIGLSVAKGMAYAADLALLGVPTLDILGYAYAPEGARACAVIQAGRTRVCAATYGRGRDGLELLGAYRIISRDELIGEIVEPTYVCGELDAPLRKRLSQELGDLVTLSSPAASLRRPGYLAELAWRRLRRGERDDVASLSPMYLTDPAAGARSAAGANS